MGRALNREQLLRQLAAEPAIVRAALKIIEQHVVDHAQPCACQDTKRAVYADGGEIDEDCAGSDDYEGCVESKRQMAEYWDKVKGTVGKAALNSAAEWLMPSTEAGMAMGAAEAGAAGLGALEGLEGIGALLALL